MSRQLLHEMAAIPRGGESSLRHRGFLHRSQSCFQIGVVLPNGLQVTTVDGLYEVTTTAKLAMEHGYPLGREGSSNPVTQTLWCLVTVDMDPATGEIDLMRYYHGYQPPYVYTTIP